MTIRAEDKITVCRHCHSADLEGAAHGRWVADGSDWESGAQVCLWPCGHEVRDREPRCLYCQPYTADEMPF